MNYEPEIGSKYQIATLSGGTVLPFGAFRDLPEGGRLILSYDGVSYYFTISYRGGNGNDIVITAQAIATDYFWDTREDKGFQAGDGSWTDDFWSADGMTLVGWRGEGNSATFAGIDGNYTVTVPGIQKVDSMAFISGTYTLSGGTIDFGAHRGVHTAHGVRAIISSVIDGSAGLMKSGEGELTLSGDNAFSGITTIAAGTLHLGEGGASGSVSGDIVNNGTLTIDRSGSFIYGGRIDGSGTVVKTGTGTTRFTAGQSLTGPVVISEGALFFTGTLGSGEITVDSGATLGGNGTCGGDVLARGKISPGSGGAGKITTGGDLSLSGTSSLDMELGTRSDTLSVQGNLALDGTLDISPAAGFSSGNYMIASCAGTLRDDTLRLGKIPAGRNVTLAIDDSTLWVSCITALIRSEPEDTVTAVQGEDALFSITAEGEGTLTYRWLFEDSTVGTAPTLTISGVKPGNAGRYRCIVADSFDIDTSAWAVLGIVVPPRITDQSADTLSIEVEKSAGFSVSASGTEPIAYRWYKVIQGEDLLLDSGAEFSIDTLSFDDSGKYYCVVSNRGGSARSGTIHLFVLHRPPEITSQPSDTAVQVGDSITFSVVADGNALPSFAWYRAGSDSILDTSASFHILEAEFSDSGSYLCVARNPGGVDSSVCFFLTVRHQPAMITGQPRDTFAIEGRSTRFAVTATGNVPPSYFWYKCGSDSVIDTTSVFVIDSIAFPDSGEYFCIVRNPGGVDTSDTVTLHVRHRVPEARFTFSPKNGTVPLEVHFTDSSLGTITSRLWRFGDGEESNLKSPAHTYRESGVFTVSLTVAGPGGNHTTIKPDSVFAFTDKQNPLRVRARFLGGYSVEVTVTNIDNIDTSSPSPRCDSAGIWIRAGTLPGGPEEGSLRRTVKRAALTGTVYTDTLTLEGPDSIFGIMTGLFWDDGTISEFLIANGTTVLMREAVIPDNPLVLRAEAITATRVRLRWNPCKEDAYTSLRIWFGTEPIDSGMIQPDSTMFSHTVVFPSDTSLVITGLSPETIYHFAIQTGIGASWSAITAKSRSSCRTPGQGAIDYRNRIAIDTLRFDSLSGRIRIALSIDEALIKEDIEAGITSGFGAYADDPAECQVIPLFESLTDTVVRLGHSIRFDSLYYISVWLRTRDGIWLDPSDSSRATVRTGAPFRQIVSLFDSVRNGGDTVRAFNDAVFLWNDTGSGDRGFTIDTLQIIGLDRVPKGMITAGTSFFFRKAPPVLPFHVGIRIHSLPKGRTLREVRIYREHEGMVSVCRETFADSIHSIVSIRVEDLRGGFMALIDTVSPEISVSSDTVSPINASAGLFDTLVITDNIANVLWCYYYGRGDQVPQLRDRGECGGDRAVVTLAIPDSAYAASSESGLRAFLSVSDGITTDTINLSRSVRRSESDLITTESNVWLPICPTGMVLRRSIEPLLERLPHGDSTIYDQRYMRLYRWVDFRENRDKEDKWVEYDPEDETVRSLFSLEPGRIFWLKTRDNSPFHLDSAFTLSLKDTFSIDLPPEQWTDLGMPYRFGIPLEEMLAATGAHADRLLIFEWKKDGKSGLYYSEPLFVPGMPDHQDRSTVMTCRPKGGYTIFNRHSETVTLRIPPVLSSMSKHPGKSHPHRTSDWSVRFMVDSGDSAAVSPVYCGYAGGLAKGALPASPSFSGFRIHVIDRKTGKKYGHHIDRDARKGFARELLISNGTRKRRGMRFSCETVGAFPEQFRIYCLDPSTGAVDTGGSLTVGAGSAVSRWLIAGDDTYCRTFLSSAPRAYALHSVYPNPARSSVMIRYTVPLGAHERLHFTIYNMLGKLIWEKRLGGLLPEGPHLEIWDGRDTRLQTVGSGMYIVRLRVMGESGRKVKQFERQLMYIR